MPLRTRKIIFIIAVILLGISGQQISSISSPAKTSKSSRYVQPSSAQLSNRETVAAYSTLIATDPDHLYDVVRTIDGDTIVIKDAAQAPATSLNEITLRLIGVDTPETVDPRKIVQCFGKEASAYTKELLIGKQVRLAADASQPSTDKYDRLLGYVYRADDDLFINKHLIENGYAHEYTYDVPYEHRDEFRLAEKRAREASRGLWAPQACK